jgi:antirestriction protein
MSNIYVACLSAYNNSYLHGCWIDCSDTTAEVIKEQVQKMLKHSPMAKLEPCEEWRIDDYQYWHGLDPSKLNFEEIATIGKFLNEQDEVTAIAFAYFAQNFNDFSSNTIDNVIEEFESFYIGCYSTKEEFVEERLEELGILDELEKYPIIEGVGADQFIDFEKIAHEWEMSNAFDFYEKCYQEVYVFSK